MTKSEEMKRLEADMASDKELRENRNTGECTEVVFRKCKGEKMYYRLKEPWTFCGWKKTPHALRALFGKHKHDNPLFMEKEVFLELLSCNGE